MARTPADLPAATPRRAPPVLRLTYPGDPPTNGQLRDRLGLAGADYLYVTATMALEDVRSEIAHPRQQTAEPGGRAVRFDRLLRHLLGPRRVLSPSDQATCLRRGARKAVEDAVVRDVVLHDASAWLEALNQLEQRGEDVTEGFPPALLEELASPALAPILTALQRGYRAERPAGQMALEEAARRFLDAEFAPPPLVVLEGFTYLLPLQVHFVRRCLEKAARVAFVHPHDPEQPDAFAVLDRTYAPYAGQAERDEVATELASPGHDLRLLQRGLFAARPPAAPHGDGSVTIAAYPHRHREVAACLRRVGEYLDGPEVDGRKPRAADVAIVLRNGGEFSTVLQEEARRLDLLDRLRIDPRLLLLTPLGRFALTLYELSPDGRLEITAEQFEALIASGWLGAAVQRTVEAFAAVRAQAFDRCRTPREWEAAFRGLAALDRDAPQLARLPGTALRPAELAAWRTALGRVAELHARLLAGPPRSIAEHIRRLRDELARLYPDDLREDERALRDRILEALAEVVGASELELDAHEMGERMAGFARGEQPAEEGPDAGKVWVTTPEALDSSPRAVVFYLGVDAARVPRPAGLPWPFFALDPQADTERERYLFLAVVRAARQELHLSYSRQGEDAAYTPSPYLAAAARLLGRADDLDAPLPASPAGAPPRPLPVLAGRADEYDLHDVAAFGLCPYRFRLERFDPSARRFREAFQLKFVAQGVWMSRTFDHMVGTGTFTDAEGLRQALWDAARAARAEVAELFPALGPIGPTPPPSVHWEAVRRQLRDTLDYLVDDWLAKPREGKPARLGYGVAFEFAGPGIDFTVEVEGRTVVVRSGLRHVVRIGRFPNALPNALTHLHWLLPSYRPEDEAEAGRARVEGIDLFPDLRTAVAWWRRAIFAALGKDADREDFRDAYRRYQEQVRDRVRALQGGRFPKHPGDHCELCPVRHTCLAAPEV